MKNFKDYFVVPFVFFLFYSCVALTLLEYLQKDFWWFLGGIMMSALLAIVIIFIK